MQFSIIRMNSNKAAFHRSTMMFNHHSSIYFTLYPSTDAAVCTAIKRQNHEECAIFCLQSWWKHICFPNSAMGAIQGGSIHFQSRDIVCRKMEARVKYIMLSYLQQFKHIKKCRKTVAILLFYYKFPSWFCHLLYHCNRSEKYADENS